MSEGWRRGWDSDHLSDQDLELFAVNTANRINGSDKNVPSW
jgi:hypothetical protein